MKLKILLFAAQRMRCSGLGSVTVDTGGAIMHEQGMVPTVDCGPGRGQAEPEI